MTKKCFHSQITAKGNFSSESSKSDTGRARLIRTRLIRSST